MQYTPPVNKLPNIICKKEKEKKNELLSDYGAQKVCLEK